MLRAAIVVALAIVGLCGPARAGVLSATDVERLRDYEQRVLPATQEMPALRDMAARIDALIAAADGTPAADSDVRPMLRDLPAIGGAALERMVASLRAIDDSAALPPPAWAAMLGEVKAEIADRLAYDAALLRAYQRSAAAGSPGLGSSIARWEERPDAALHWRRFEAAMSAAAPGGARGEGVLSSAPTNLSPLAGEGGTRP